MRQNGLGAALVISDQDIQGADYYGVEGKDRTDLGVFPKTDM